MIVIVAPGQGSQTPGFLTPWLEVPGVREHVEALSDAAGVNLLRHGTESDEATIKDTAVAQPLIVGAGLAALAPLREHLGGMDAFGALSGHSVGEITAAAAAGVLNEVHAMRFVALRGSSMAAASAETPTGMSAVLGGDPDDVTATLVTLDLTPANVNGAGQVVAAGSLDALSSLSEHPPAKARVIPLKVAGAFHTQYMSSALDALSKQAAQLTPADAQLPLVSNADGEIVTDGNRVLSRLVSQVCNPVRWDLCMDRFAALGVTGIIELAPAGTLVGLAKRALRGVPTVALKVPDDLDSALALLKGKTA